MNTNSQVVTSKRKFPFNTDNPTSKQMKTSSRSKSSKTFLSFSDEINMEMKFNLSKTSVIKKKSFTCDRRNDYKGGNFKVGCIRLSLSENVNRIVKEENKIKVRTKQDVSNAEELIGLIKKEEYDKINLLLEISNIIEDIKQIDEILNNEVTLKEMRASTILNGLKENISFAWSLIDTMESNIHKLEQRILTSNEEIDKENLKFIQLSENEKQIEKTKVQAGLEILKLEEESKIIERRTKVFNKDLEKLLNKKEELHKLKIETQSNILVLKPYNKKFCILRKSNSILKNNFTLPKNRKNILLNKTNDGSFATLIRFDGVISLIENVYEEINFTNESIFIDLNLSAIIIPFIMQMNIDQHINTSNVSSVLELEAKLIPTTNKTNEAKIKDSPNEQDKDTYAYSFKIFNRDAKLSLMHLSYEDENVKTLLSKFDESSLSKKKYSTRYGSSSKTLPSKTLMLLQDELNIDNTFYTIVIVDLFAEELNQLDKNKSLCELLYSI